MNTCPYRYNSDPLKMPLHGQIDTEIYGESVRPALDRIHLHIEVAAVKYKSLSSTEYSESSEAVRAR